MLSPFLFILHQMNFLRKNFIAAWICGLTIFVLSTMPGRYFPHVGVSNFDKIVHFFMYFGFATTLLWSMYYNRWNNAPVKAFFMAAIFGFSLEIIQLLTFEFAHRYFEWWDVFCNSMGALVATVLIEFLLKKTFIFKVK